MATSFHEQSVDETLFCCGYCRAVWNDPVTMKCGHTFCRGCLRNDSSHECHGCREFFDKSHELRTNVLLSAVVEKCFPDAVHLARLNPDDKEMLPDRNVDLLTEASEKALDDDNDAPHKCSLETFDAATELFQEALDENQQDSGHDAMRLHPELTESVSEGVRELSSMAEKKKQNRVELLTTEDFECALCLRLLFCPITTQCGHVFCRDCIYRSLDYRSVCPLCKESLAEFLEERREATTEAVEKIIERFFAEELEMRGRLENEEIMQLPRAISNNRQEIPIFVCTIAYPGMPCPLRIFEPRYRLMMRRCMETGTRQFGMCTCLESREENFYEFGTVLEIRGIDYQPDGQSFVDCVGGRRFRVLSRGIRDGYRTAEVEYLRDECPSQEQIDDLQQLQSDVHAQAVQWFTGIHAMARTNIIRSFGDIPALMPAEDLLLSPDGPTWIWFMTAILPLDQRAQLSLLSMTSLKDRLVALQRVLEYFRRHGYGGS